MCVCVCVCLCYRIYHATKCLDALLFQFYAKNDHLRLTDLHQGIVWGTNTAQSARDERLCNRFDYDGEYGTVLNRFLMQAACGIPLTVYGTGGQTRGFIHISDTCRCIELAINNPPSAGQPVEAAEAAGTVSRDTWRRGPCRSSAGTCATDKVVATPASKRWNRCVAPVAATPYVGGAPFCFLSLPKGGL